MDYVEVLELLKERVEWYQQCQRAISKEMKLISPPFKPSFDSLAQLIASFQRATSSDWRPTDESLSYEKVKQYWVEFVATGSQFSRDMIMSIKQAENVMYDSDRHKYLSELA